MTDEKRKRLEEAGFRVGTIAEFLDLTPEEQAKIDNKQSALNKLKALGLNDAEINSILGK